MSIFKLSYLIDHSWKNLKRQLEIIRFRNNLVNPDITFTLNEAQSLSESILVQIMYILYLVYQKKLDQSKMKINFCFIIDIRFMSSFLILMFFKEGLTKKWNFNQIISTDIYKCKKYIWCQNGYTENNNFTATLILSNKTLQSLHVSGKFSFSYKF